MYICFKGHNFISMNFWCLWMCCTASAIKCRLWANQVCCDAKAVKQEQLCCCCVLHLVVRSNSTFSKTEKFSGGWEQIYSALWSVEITSLQVKLHTNIWLCLWLQHTLLHYIWYHLITLKFSILYAFMFSLKLISILIYCSLFTVVL